MRACSHAACRLFGRQNDAKRKATANALGHHHHVRFDPRPFMREQLACPANAALDLIHDQQRAGFITQIAQPLEALIGHGANAAFALNRFDHDRGHFGIARGLLQGLMIAKFQLNETGQQRAKTLDHFFGVHRRNRRRGPAVERTAKGDDLDALGLALFVPVLAHHFHDQLTAFRARVGEKRGVGKGLIDQSIGQRLLLGDLIEVRQVPHLGRLIGQRLNEVRVRMAQRVHRNTRTEIQKTIYLGEFEFEKIFKCFSKK